MALSLRQRLGLGLILAGSLLVVGGWACWNAFSGVLAAVQAQQDVIYWTSAYWYALSAGAGILVVFCDGAYVFWVNRPRPHSPAGLKVFGVLFFGSFILMFIMPHVLQPILVRHVELQGYHYCPELNGMGTRNHRSSWYYYRAWVREPALCVARG